MKNTLMNIIRNKTMFIAYAILLISGNCAYSDDVKKSSFDDHISKGREFILFEDYDNAISEYKKTLKLKPDSAIAHYELGVSYFKKWEQTFNAAQERRLTDAFTNPTQHKQILSSFKEQDKIYEYYGEKREFRELALKEFEETLKYDPDNWEARYYVAVHLENNGFYDEAIKEFKKILKVKPDHEGAYAYMASAYFGKGLYELAIEKYKEAIKLVPYSGYYHYELALTYLEIGKKKEAIKELEELKRLNSSFYNDLKGKIKNKDK